MIGMGLRLQLIEAPAIYTKIGKARSRGRPKKIGPAVLQTLTNITLYYLKYYLHSIMFAQL